MTTENHATEWEETNVEATTAAAKKWQEDKARSYAKRPPQGRSVWRFLPAIKGTGGNPFKHVWVHFVRDRNDRDTIIASGLCPLKMGTGASCVVCAESSRLRKTGLKEDSDYGSSLRAENHIYANTVNLEEDEPKVIVMNVPQDVYKTLTKLLADPVAGGDFTHPKTGYNIVINRSGTGKNDTEYDAIPARSASEFPYMALLGKMNDLTAAAGLLDTAVAQASFGGKALPSAAGGAAPEGRQIESKPQEAPSQDMVEDPVTGKWIPKASLQRSSK